MIFYRVFTGKTCFPLPIDKSSTFSSNGLIITINPSTNLTVGDYLYSIYNNELKKITDIISSTQYKIESAFTFNVESEQVKIADKSIVYTKASISNFTKINGLFNGQTLFKRNVINIDGNIFFTIDGTGTTIAILAQ